MAEHLSQQLGKPCSAAGFRQTLGRARALFGNLLLDEVARTLETPTVEEVKAELADLDLLEWARPALERWTEEGGGACD
jgi:hypothetical protein